MTKNNDKVSEEGAVELTEDELNQASGGAGYLKISSDNNIVIKRQDPSIKGPAPVFKF